MQGFPQCSRTRIIPGLRGIITLDLLGNIDSVVVKSRRASPFGASYQMISQAMVLSGNTTLHGSVVAGGEVRVFGATIERMLKPQGRMTIG